MPGTVDRRQRVPITVARSYAQLATARALQYATSMGITACAIDEITMGTRIGDYVVDGALGDDYTAHHVLLPRRVRLEVMHPTLAGHRDVAVRMMREACILEALHHPGAPRVYEVGMLLRQQSPRPWIATELVRGENLADRIDNGERLAINELLAVISQVARILAHAHARNVAHGGVRLDAIVLDDGSRGYPLCLINWNTARVSDSPDEASRLFADDVFALGLVADVVMPSRSAMPAALGDLLDDMLAPNPASRPSAADVATRAQEISDELESPALEPEQIVEEVAETPSRPIRWTPPSGYREQRVSTPPPIPSRARS